MVFIELEQIKKDRSLPGRFRYDRDSENEEEEDDDDYEEWTQRNHSSYYNDDDEEEEKSESEENKESTENAETNTSTNKYLDMEVAITIKNENFVNSENSKQRPAVVNTFQANYNTYRRECSRIMSNDAYEPDSVTKEGSSSSQPTDTPPLTSDLRNLLRSRALTRYDKQDADEEAPAITNSTTNVVSSAEPYDPCYPSNDMNIYYNPNMVVGDDENNFEYQYQPITKPISVDPTEFYNNNGGGCYNNNDNTSMYVNYRGNRWPPGLVVNSNWSNGNNNNANYRNNSTGYFRRNDHRGYNSNNNNAFNNSGGFNSSNYYYDENGQTGLNEERGEEAKNDVEDDEEEEEFIRNKKLRSIVVPKQAIAVVASSSSNTDSVSSSSNNSKYLY